MVRQRVPGGDDHRSRPSEELGPAVSDSKERGWDSVVVEESDVVACGGYLPERCIAIAGGGDYEAETAAGLENEVPQHEAKSSDPEEGGTNWERGGEVTQVVRAEGGELGCDEGVGDGGTGLVRSGRPQALASGGKRAARPGKRRRNAKTKPICVMTCALYNLKRLLNFRRIPAVFRKLTVVKRTHFFWETKPIPGVVSRRAEAEVRRRRRPLTEREQRDAWKEIRRRGVDSVAGGERGAGAGVLGEVELGGRERCG